MPEVSQYSFSLKEIAEVLVRERGIKTGSWLLAIEFGVGIGNFGDPQSQMAIRPGVMMTITGAMLSKVPEPPPPGPVPDFVIDAASVWGEDQG